MFRRCWDDVALPQRAMKLEAEVIVPEDKQVVGI
jgi:hypothetical protein